jgi:hypothetical protein
LSDTTPPAETLAPAVEPEAPSDSSVIASPEAKQSEDDVVKVDYETPAPTISEQATDTGKLVTISAPSEKVDCEPLNPNKKENVISSIFKNSAAGLLDGFANFFKAIAKFFTADLENAVSDAVQTIVDQIIPPVVEPAPEVM